MKITADIKLDLDLGKLDDIAEKAGRLAMRDTVVAAARKAVSRSPWLTGHNRRSICGEVSGMGYQAAGEEATPEPVVDDNEIEGALFSTSGYGGYLETGTVKTDPRPYIKPSIDEEFTDSKFGQRMRRHME
jgi:hypothetical protein